MGRGIVRWRNSGTRTGKDRGHGGGAGEGRASQAPLKRGGLPPKSRESPEQVQSRPGDTISPLAAVTSKARRGQRSSRWPVRALKVVPTRDSGDVCRDEEWLHGETEGSCSCWGPVTGLHLPLDPLTDSQLLAFPSSPCGGRDWTFRSKTLPRA